MRDRGQFLVPDAGAIAFGRAGLQCDAGFQPVRPGFDRKIGVFLEFGSSSSGLEDRLTTAH
jgi:hypothetical protein